MELTPFPGGIAAVNLYKLQKRDYYLPLILRQYRNLLRFATAPDWAGIQANNRIY